MVVVDQKERILRGEESSFEGVCCCLEGCGRPETGEVAEVRLPE
jgi:hypothetical protein